MTLLKGGAPSYSEKALEILRQFGLENMANDYPANLSGGQRQRVLIARALASNPEILILDDSSSALDYATDAALRKALRTLPENTTVFIVSQRAASLMHADQIIVLDDGQITGIGTHAELLNTCDTYKEIYNSQDAFCEEAMASAQEKKESTNPRVFIPETHHE